MTSSAGVPTITSPTWRVAPSLPVAFGVFVAYVVVVLGLMATSGREYTEFFDSGANAFRAAVVPLIGGSLVLIAFLLWSRWDGVFRDPARLPMRRVLWIPIVIFAIGILVHFAVAGWGRVDGGLLAAIVAAGVLVGFAEETLFRGIILRALRTNRRPEASVMLISSLWFGLFHATNILVGSPLTGVITQVILASLSGVALYLFRRARGLLVMGMVAHGLWDMGAFLPTSEGTLALLNLGIQILVATTAIVAAIAILRHDKKITATASGIQPLGV